MSYRIGAGVQPDGLWRVLGGLSVRLTAGPESPRRFLHVERQSRVSVAPSGECMGILADCGRLEGIRAGAC